MDEVKFYDSFGNLKRVITVKTEYPINKTAGIPMFFQEKQKNRETAGKPVKHR